MSHSWTGRDLLSTRTSKPIHIGKILSHGGEGAVYHLDGRPLDVVKIYHQAPDQERCQKLSVLAQITSTKLRSIAALPTDVVHDGRQVLGYIMPLVPHSRTAHACFHPIDRKRHSPKATYAWLIAIARNIAAVVDEIHQADIVIGDLNESGFLVNLTPEHQTLVAAIDSDSFQIRQGSQLYRCQVGKPEFTPPELQGIDLGQVERTIAHDAFSLGVLIYQMLMMARHPYAGDHPQDFGDGVAPAIKRGWYVHSKQAQLAGVKAVRASLGLHIVTPAIRDLWMQAFVGDPGNRPKAQQWVAALDAFQKELKTCELKPHHRYIRTASECPWCDFVVSHCVDYFPLHASGDIDIIFELPLNRLRQAMSDVLVWIDGLSTPTLQPSLVHGNAPEWAGRVDGMVSAYITAGKEALDAQWLLVQAYQHWQMDLAAWQRTCTQIQGRYVAEVTVAKANYDHALGVFTRDIERWRQYCQLLEREFCHTVIVWHEGHFNEIGRCRSLMATCTTTAACCMVGLIVMQVPPAMAYGWPLACLLVLLSILHMATARSLKRSNASPPQAPAYPDPPQPPAQPQQPILADYPQKPERPPGLLSDEVPTFSTLRETIQQQWDVSLVALKLDITHRSDGFAAQAKTQQERLLQQIRAMRVAIGDAIGNGRSLISDYERMQIMYADARRDGLEAAKQDAYAAYLDTIPVRKALEIYSFPKNVIPALEHYGIDSAKDVVDLLIPGKVKVPGCGPGYTNRLAFWISHHVANKYVENPQALWQTTTMQSVIQRFQRQKAQLETGISTMAARSATMRKEFDPSFAEQVREMEARLRDWGDTQQELTYLDEAFRSVTTALDHYQSSLQPHALHNVYVVAPADILISGGSLSVVIARLNASQQAVITRFDAKVPANTTHGTILIMPGIGHHLPGGASAGDVRLTLRDQSTSGDSEKTGMDNDPWGEGMLNIPLAQNYAPANVNREQAVQRTVMWHWRMKTWGTCFLIILLLAMLLFLRYAIITYH